VREDIRNYFKKAQEFLRELQKEKLADIDRLFIELFGFNIDLGEY
jgi:hypothetical protein